MKRAILLGAVWLLAGAFPAQGDYASRPALIVPGGMVLFYNSQGPLSYVALTRRELPAEAVDAGPVYAQSCQYALTVPLSLSLSATSLSGAAGNGGFNKAIGELRRERADVRGLYDVMVDLHRTSVLGTFSRLCTEIHARGYRWTDTAGKDR
jgi:hypothetical protein